MKIIAALLCCLGFGLLNSAAQNPAKPASNDPMAGLNLSDSTTPSPSANAGPSASPIVTPSPYVDHLKGHLVSMVNGRLQDFDASALKDVQYWAFYRSASWCPPCRAFTPQLVEFYESFKARHPNFELVFVCSDKTEDAMESYMSGDNMTWPTVKFGERQDVRPFIGKFFGNAIPDLVLTDGNGKLLSSTFVDGQYAGPEHVLEDIQKMVPLPGKN